MKFLSMADPRRLTYAVPRLLGWAGITLAFALLCAPVAPWLTPDMALLWHKAVAVLGGRWGCVATGLALLVLAIGLLQLARQRQQALLDARAADIMEAMRQDPRADIAPFLLYLRAFETTGHLHVPLFVRLRRASLDGMRGITADLESYFGAAVRGSTPLIALGSPGESVGAGRIVTVDNRWQVDIDLLIRRATGILLVPSDRPGTLWEIDKLHREGMLPKVIFVMPPLAQGGYDSTARWNAARAAAADIGLDLPPYDPQGLLFELDAQGHFLQAEALLAHAPRAMRRSFRRLLDPAAPATTLAQSLATARERTRRAAIWGWMETGRQLSPYALALAAPLGPLPPADFVPTESWAQVLVRSVGREDAPAPLAAESTSAAAPSAAFAALDRTPIEDLIQTLNKNQQERFNESLALSSWSQLVEQGQGDMPAFFQIGFPLLTPARQREWLRTRADMLNRLHTDLCAQQDAGKLTDDAALAFVARPSLAKFVTIETDAFLAAVESLNTPAHESASPAEEISSAELLRGLRDRLSPQEQVRLDAALKSELSDAGGAELHCWLHRTALADRGDDFELARAILARQGASARAKVSPSMVGMVRLGLAVNSGIDRAVQSESLQRVLPGATSR